MSIASAAIAPGKVSSEGNRKAIQHRDGGPIAAVLVREGEKVSKGQPLIELDLVETKSEEATLATARLQYLSKIARLRAESKNADAISLPAELIDLASDIRQVRTMLDEERSFFDARRASFLASVRLLQQLIEGSKAQIKTYDARIVSSELEKKLTIEELESVRPLERTGLVTKPRLLTLQRSAAKLDGDVESLRAGVSNENSKIASAELQIKQLEKQRQEDIAKDLNDTEMKLADVQPRLAAAREKLARGVLVAPEDGFVYGLAVYSVGSVLTPGQVVLEIVPAKDPLVISAQVDPKDIQRVQPGQDAMIKLTGLPTYDRILLHGTLKRVSHDRFDDPKQNNLSYYSAIISVRADDLKRYKVDLTPGMPAEVMITTGERAILSYLLDPILRVYDFALHEQ